MSLVLNDTHAGIHFRILPFPIVRSPNVQKHLLNLGRWHTSMYQERILIHTQNQNNTLQTTTIGPMYKCVKELQKKLMYCIEIFVSEVHLS